MNSGILNYNSNIFYHWKYSLSYSFISLVLIQTLFGNVMMSDVKYLILESICQRSNQSILKEKVLNIHWKDWCWSWNSNTLATWWEELTHLKRPWCWEGLIAGGEGDNRGWNGWMMSLTQWTWVRQGPEDGERQGSLACCSPWGRKESDSTYQLNNKFLILSTVFSFNFSLKIFFKRLLSIFFFFLILRLLTTMT